MIRKCIHPLSRRVSCGIGDPVRCALLLLSFMGMSRAADRPNILFMFTDDQPQICMGCMGNEHIQTPHLDRLAAEGVLFENAFVTTAICCSNRACILTGQHMRRHGIRDFRTPLSAEAFQYLSDAASTNAGYRTGYLGKFAVGSRIRRPRTCRCRPTSSTSGTVSPSRSIFFRRSTAKTAT